MLTITRYQAYRRRIPQSLKRPSIEFPSLRPYDPPRQAAPTPETPPPAPTSNNNNLRVKLESPLKKSESPESKDKKIILPVSTPTLEPPTRSTRLKTPKMSPSKQKSVCISPSKFQGTRFIAVNANASTGPAQQAVCPLYRATCFNSLCQADQQISQGSTSATVPKTPRKRAGRKQPVCSSNTS